MDNQPVRDIKDLAHTLKGQLKDLGHDVPLGHVLETLSHLQGSRDWNTLKALADKGTLAQLAVAQAAAPADDAQSEVLADLTKWLASFKPSPLRIWRLLPKEGNGMVVEVRFGLSCEERRYRISSPDWLAFGLRLASESSFKGFVYLQGRAWRCLPQAKEAEEVFTLNGKRACMTALVGRRNKSGHVLVGYALEDEPGAHPVPSYNYGESVDEAEKGVDAFNESRGVPKDEAMHIVLTSMSPEGMEREHQE